MPWDEVDLNDPRVFDDPWDFYRWLRRDHPVWFDERSGLYAISRHADVVDISRRPDLYSSAAGVRPLVPVPMSLISMDDPEHARQRRLISRGFTPRQVRELTGHIRTLANEIVDEIEHRGEIDFVADVAMHVPLIVIAELMGLDPTTRDRLYAWSEAMMAGDGHVEADDPVLAEAAHAFGEYTAVCSELIAARRDAPKDDIISILTQAFDEGELQFSDEAKAQFHDDAAGGLTNDELLLFCALLVVAGNETTRNAITGGLRGFSLFPGEREKLLADPSLIDTAVEEIVRWTTPVMAFTRTVTREHERHGVTLREGDRVLLLYQSANRDEEVFDDPDAFRIDRDPNPHVAFGFGPHFCLGANLARVEVKVVFEELFRRLPDIRAADPAAIQRGDSTLVLAIQHLPAVFTPLPVATPRVTTAGLDQRTRILGVALDLMARHGVRGTSMRRLASECDLNVATLYHYFPSKADLLRAVIDDRDYEGLLRDVSVPLDPRLPPRDRLVTLLTTIWRETLAERPVWRLLIGESLRGDPDALAVAAKLSARLEDAIDRWLGESFPELPTDHRGVSSVVVGQLLSFFLEDLLLSERDRRDRLDTRVAATAAVIFPS